jgi:hypothetical protein
MNSHTARGQFLNWDKQVVMTDRRLSVICLLVLVLSLAGSARAADPLYRADFEKAEVGKLPDEFLVIAGDFLVAEKGGNKFLELPGVPLDSYSALAGPTEKDGLEASGRFYGTSKGRRAPSFGLGLNGVSGYRLQVSAAKNAIELFRYDVSRARAPFQWVTGKWSHLKMQVVKSGAGWKILGKAWSEGQPEPAEWMISHEDHEELPAGRLLIYGSPFSGTPIWYDDLIMAKAQE